ncbi:hypothetical protein Lal_00013356 [Lupinus albus]|nr:hypothetical protein Lal_00013356 [Lupinus albus]
MSKEFFKLLAPQCANIQTITSLKPTRKYHKDSKEESYAHHSFLAVESLRGAWAIICLLFVFTWESSMCHTNQERPSTMNLQKRFKSACLYPYLYRNNMMMHTCKLNKGIHWIVWSEVCKPKKLGGLGVKDLSWFNDSLMGKWKWRRVVKLKDLWVKVVNSKYSKD